jgi:hypothetical protein
MIALPLGLVRTKMPAVRVLQIREFRELSKEFIIIIMIIVTIIFIIIIIYICICIYIMFFMIMRWACETCCAHRLQCFRVHAKHFDDLIAPHVDFRHRVIECKYILRVQAFIT